MNIIGLSIGEQCAASLIIDGKLVGASQEERFEKKKGYSGFPTKTLGYLLKQNNLKKRDIDYVYVINEQVTGLEFSLIQRFNSFSIEDYLAEAKNYYYPILFKNKKVQLLKIFKKKIVKKTFPKTIVDELIKNGENNKNTQIIRKKLVNEFFGKKVNVKFINHHFSHALYAYITNPINFKKALIFTADSLGDNENSNVYLADQNSMQLLFKSNKLNLGRLFRNLTLLLGLKPYQHEYKLMGLAPYAKKKEASKVKLIFKKYLQKFDGKWIYKKKPKDHYFTFKKLLEGFRFDNIAGGLQSYFEEIILGWFLYFIKRYKKIDTVMFSGGLAMNIKLNQKIDELCKKHGLNFFVAPSSDDYSHVLSLPFFHYVNNNKKIKKITMRRNSLRKKINNLNLGFDFNKFNQQKVLNWASSKNWKIQNLNLKKLSYYLEKDKVFALCHGNSEFGARALGFRSIIADPKNFDIVKKINLSVKKRDFWMPFAPAILDNYQKKYLKINNFKNHYFMASGADVSEVGKKIMSAAIHPYDLSSRPQIVSKDKNMFFYRIIKSFGDFSGRYTLLNTSLNLHGLPIVNDYKDLIYILENSLIDGCILENKIILRNF